MSTIDTEMARLRELVAEYERTHDVPQRGLIYSTSASGTEADRKYVFGDQILFSKSAAYERLRFLAVEYGVTS